VPAIVDAPVHAARFSRLRSLIIAVGVLVSVAFAGSSVCDAWRIYNQSIDQTNRELGNIARALAEHGAQTFRTVNVESAMYFDGHRQFYSAIELGPTGVISVLREDGTLLLRHPSAPSQLGRLFPELMVHPSEADRVVTITEGRPVYAAVAKMRDLPLMVAVTRDRDVALQAWQQEAISLSVRTGVGILVVILGIAALLRQLRREQLGEAALRQSEERYALAMEGANEGHWDWDLETDQLFVSPKMKALAGLSADTPVRTRAELLACMNIHADDLPHLHALVDDHIQGRTPLFELEYRVRHAEGEWHWLLARGRALRDSTGKAYRFVGSAIDVTARKKAESEKERLETQLRQSQKMEAMGTLAGGIAHDFNNILGAILGYGELAQKHTPEVSPARRYLSNVMHAAGRAKTLVDGILRFSRSGLAERAPVNIQSVVEESVMIVAASLPPRVRLEKRLDCGNAAVAAEPTQIQQIAMNLLTNALHAMENGGTVKLELDCVDVQAARTLMHGALARGSYVRLTVSDTGTGIAPEALDRIFDPFFTTKRVGEGTGLGLSVVHGIVVDLGGAIEVASEAAVGTTFTIWLPVSAQIETVANVIPRAAPRGNGETVMIVDDERPLVALAEEMLAELGYEPSGFHSSTAALQAFRKDPQSYDVVLTDETMPDLLGTDLAREIARLRPDIPILLMSGYAGKQLGDRAQASGVTEVLRKPLVSRDIAESLARALSTRQAAAA
jgi:PAS domain S-box-containing protein